MCLSLQKFNRYARKVRFARKLTTPLQERVLVGNEWTHIFQIFAVCFPPFDLRVFFYYFESQYNQHIYYLDEMFLTTSIWVYFLSVMQIFVDLFCYYWLENIDQYSGWFTFNRLSIFICNQSIIQQISALFSIFILQQLTWNKFDENQFGIFWEYMIDLHSYYIWAKYPTTWKMLDFINLESTYLSLCR